jgi:hypothetical protein
VTALLIAFAASGEAEPSKVPFYVAGGILVAWALLVSVFAIRQETFPTSEGQARGVMGITVLLIAAAMATAVITA